MRCEDTAGAHGHEVDAPFCLFLPLSLAFAAPAQATIKPTELKLTPAPLALDATWNVSSTTGLTGFRVRWRPVGAKPYTGTVTLEAGARAYNMTPLEGKPYEVWVTALETKTGGSAKAIATPLAEEKEEEHKEETGTAGEVKIRYDARSFADSIPIEWFKGINRIMGYPPGGDRYPAAGYSTIAYHDAWTNWGAGGLTPGHIAEYRAKVERDKGIGYAGQMADDINFNGGNIAGTRQQYLELIEAIRAGLGPTGALEINAQYGDIWPLMQAHEPIVEKALTFVTDLTKEFNVDPTSGINTAAKYSEFINGFVETLRLKGIHIAMSGDGSHDTTADREYSLATYFLLNDSQDRIGFHEQTPSNEWVGLRLNIGAATSARERASSGVWKRTFVGGVAYTNEPGNSSQTIKFGPHHTLAGAAISEATLAGAHGIVLLP